MTVYLEDGVTPARAQKVAAALGKLPGVVGVRTVDAHEAWSAAAPLARRARRSARRRRGGLSAGVDRGVAQAGRRRGAARASGVRAAAPHRRRRGRRADGQLGVAACATSSICLSVAGWAVAALVLCACLYIVGSTIRLGVFARRDEIEIWKLVGATNGFVKAPFLVEGGAAGRARHRAGGRRCSTRCIGSPRRASRRCSAAGWRRVRSASSRRRSSALAIAGGALLGLCGSALALGRYVKV